MELINMDGVGVPKRVLRKAETVLTRRTDRLSIVIERSTNSQHSLYLFLPRCCLLFQILVLI